MRKLDDFQLLIMLSEELNENEFLPEIIHFFINSVMLCFVTCFSKIRVEILVWRLLCKKVQDKRCKVVKEKHFPCNPVTES